ncbi:peptide transporter family 1-like isoform X2 [Sitodiplosis mosellana]|uniref:peptide transporter family 1-like isoform X2 n=1 Tax=Sitodiplosis mosellana TaxID=263140 RepID=UPI0024439D6C|nr:peptide transporter family 1-like isoform X2 [Sitodiplosis mosellana]
MQLFHLPIIVHKKMAEKVNEVAPVLNDEHLQRDYGTLFNPNSIDSNQVQLRYPKAVIFVLLSKLLESFVANGVRTVFVTYLHNSLNFSQESATNYFHIFNFFGQLCPIFGAIVADNYLGNVKTIFYLFFLYATGWIAMSILTFPLSLASATSIPLIITALIVIAIGNGSIRACVTSLGGAQFVLPRQSRDLDRYFSHYYFVYTLGILLSKIIPPEIEKRTHCFGKTECYSAVFGSLGVVFLAAWLVFLLVFGCIYAGVKHKLKNVRHHTWIDGTKDQYTTRFIEDVCTVLKVLKLFIPLPMYWALYAQIDSTWTFQSSQMNTTVFGYPIASDEAKAAAPFLLLILIPIWEKLNPLIRAINIEISPLKSMAMGGLSAALSFFCAAILQLYIESHTSTDNSRLSIFWQIPQFLLLMFGEVWLSIPGLNFSFTQSPPSMRSVMMAAWFCNNAFGNLIVILINEIRPFQLYSCVYFLYGSLMFISVITFSWLARYYHYVNYNEFHKSDQNANVVRRSSIVSI